MNTKRYEYTLEEKLTYQRTMIIESELEEEVLYNILESHEKYYNNVEDLADALDMIDIKVIVRADSDTRSPSDMEIEHYDIIKICPF